MGLLNTVLDMIKEKFTVLLTFLTGHCHLNKHLYQLGTVNDPVSRCFEKEHETMDHVIYHFLILVKLRGAMIGEHWLNMVEYRLACGVMPVQKSGGNIMGLLQPECRNSRNRVYKM